MTISAPRGALPLLLVLSLSSLAHSFPASVEVCTDYRQYMRVVGRWGLEESSELCALGNYVYLTGGNALHVFDVTQPDSPALRSSLALQAFFAPVTAQGQFLYVASEGLTVFDISDPSAPSRVGNLSTRTFRIVVSGSYLYATSWPFASIKVISIATPGEPSLVAEQTLSSAPPIDLAVQGSLLAVATDAELWLLNVADPLDPVVMSILSIPAGTKAVELSGSLALAVGTGGVSIIDVSNPGSPFVLSTTPVPGEALAITLTGATAFIGGSIVSALDITDPLSPAILASMPRLYSGGLACDGAYLYLASEGLQIVDVTRLASPSPIGGVATPGVFTGLVVYPYAYLARGGLLDIFNIENPAAPVFLSSIAARCYTVAVADAFAYCTNGGGLDVIDIADPRSPVLVGTTGVGWPMWPVAIDVQLPYIYASGGIGLRVFDVSSPSSPLLVSETSVLEITDLTVVGSNLFTTGQYRILEVIDVSNPAMPRSISHVIGGGGRGLAIVDDLAFVAGCGLYVIDITSVEVPRVLGHSTCFYGGGSGVAVDGDVAYVAGYGFDVIDIYDPSSPKAVGAAYGGDSVQKTSVAGGVLWCAGGALVAYPIHCPAGAVAPSVAQESAPVIRAWPNPAREFVSWELVSAEGPRTFSWGL